MPELYYDVFIAYAREDLTIANALRRIFTKRGWHVFIDTDIGAGGSFAPELEQALDSSRAVVVL